jgi:KaiC/GvpD/RAD55 family RecA-like ATPase
MKAGDVFPGSKRLVEGEMPPSSMLLMGPSGIGKTIFCKQFIYNGLAKNEPGIYLSTDESPERIEKTMKSFGFDTEPYASKQLFRVVDCYSWRIGGKSTSKYCVNNAGDLAAISSTIDSARQGLTKTRLVLDSITGLMTICSHNLTVLSKFLQVIAAKNRAAESNAVFLVTPEAHDQVFMSYLREIFDGTLEMKMETKKSDSNEEILRLLRLFSLKGARHKTNWTPFEITSEGISLKSETDSRCLMCSRLIEWEPTIEIIEGKEYRFDSLECASTYKRLKSLYGPSFE